ncbi:MAG: hypothetical protein ACYCTV_05255 [Leptospirales bacterium]
MATLTRISGNFGSESLATLNQICGNFGSEYALYAFEGGGSDGVIEIDVIIKHYNGRVYLKSRKEWK